MTQHQRDSLAESNLILSACRTGRSVDEVLNRPAPVTLLRMPFLVPRDVLSRIVGKFVPRDMPTPNLTRYDG
jgi:hypothetical protein